MKFLGIDYGQKRTGIAVSNPEGTLAFPRTTIMMSSRDAFFAELLGIAAIEGTEAFVIGYPTHTDGTECLSTTQVKNMAKRLRRRTDLPIYFISEVLTSYEAENMLRSVKKNSRENKYLIDQLAAVSILQTFLDTPPERRTPA